MIHLIEVSMSWHGDAAASFRPEQSSPTWPARSACWRGDQLQGI
jgi:hypothetical protein